MSSLQAPGSLSHCQLRERGANPAFHKGVAASASPAGGAAAGESAAIDVVARALIPIS
jgi:hypothetical protein